MSETDKLDLLNDLEFEVTSEEPAIPAIYTSEDEHINSPSHDYPNEAFNPNYVHKQNQETDSYLKVESDVPIKKPRLASMFRSSFCDGLLVPSGLVSYAIDEDDDEHTILDGDREEEENNSGVDEFGIESERKLTLKHKTNPIQLASPSEDGRNLRFIRSTEPPTILSLEHYQFSKQSINTISNELLVNHNISEPYRDAAPNDVQSSKDPNQDSMTISERLIRDVQLLAEPTGHCAMELQEKVDRAVRRMRLDISYDPNRAIQDNKSFRNPSIYEKLITFLNVDEKGTNFPNEIYDPYRWSSHSHYDELARIQNREIDRLMKLQKEQKKTETNTTNSQIPNSTNLPKSSSSGALGVDKSAPTTTVYTGYMEPKKLSKWDTGLPPNNNLLSFDAFPNETNKPQIIAPIVGSLIKRK